MNKPEEDRHEQDLLPEYDFSQGVRGKYAKRYEKGSNVVVVAPDLVAAFPTSKAVNDALRQLVKQQSDKPRVGRSDA